MEVVFSKNGCGKVKRNGGTQGKNGGESSDEWEEVWGIQETSMMEYLFPTFYLDLKL